MLEICRAKIVNGQILLRHLIIPVFRIWDEPFLFWVHDEVRVLQGNLAEQIGHLFVDIDDLENPMSAHDIQAHRVIHAADSCPVRGL